MSEDRASEVGEHLTAQDRLRRKADFEKCYKRGRRLQTSLLTLHFAPNVEARARLGMTVSRKVGNSVVRQKLKRRVRELFRRFPDRGRLPPMDYVVHLKPTAAQSAFDGLAQDLRWTLATVISRSERTG